MSAGVWEDFKGYTFTCPLCVHYSIDPEGDPRGKYNLLFEIYPDCFGTCGHPDGENCLSYLISLVFDADDPEERFLKDVMLNAVAREKLTVTYVRRDGRWTKEYLRHSGDYFMDVEEYDPLDLLKSSGVLTDVYLKFGIKPKKILDDIKNRIY